MGDGGRTDPAAAAAKKRPRSGSDSSADLRRVAEIVMVLSAVGKMRGGWDPTAVEKALAMEARELLAAVCEEEKPKDLFSREAVRVIVEDLGLNRSKEPLAKLSIVDKLLLTKRRMEEPKEFATVHSPQPLPAGFGANSESHGTMLHGPPRLLPDRRSSIVLSTGGFQSASPAVHVPDLSSGTTLLKQLHVNESQPATALVKSSTSLHAKDSPLSTLHHTEAAHFRLDERPTGQAYITQFQGTASSAEYTPVKTPTTPLQSISAATVKLGQENKFLDHTLVKSEGVHESPTFQSSHQVMRSQGTQTSIIQATPGNLLIGHQPSQALTYVHATSYFANHNDIAKSVQQVLQQKVCNHPNWIPPSIDYMNKPLNCQICKIIINDMDSSLVCDDCEKGTHLKCLQSYVNKGIPKAEWHCPKCLLASNGKPLPPRYGRVTRSIAASKVSLNTVGTHASVEKRAEQPDSVVNDKKIIPNGNSGLPYPIHASNMVNNHSESTLDSKVTSAGEIQGLDFLATRMKREDGMHTVNSNYQPNERAEMVCVTLGTQSESSDKQVESRGLSPSDIQGSTSDLILESKIDSEQVSSFEYQNDTSKITHQFQVPSDSQACNGMEVLAGVEVSTNQQNEITEPVSDEFKSCDLRETPKCKGAYNIRPDERETSQASSKGAFDNGNATIDYGRPSPSDLHTVDWVGDILESADDKTYYRSCCINGALHKLQDHVLIFSNSRNLFPSKLQYLWEDKKTGSKWATVDPYYFPSDLPEVVDQPSTPEKNEVYASNNGNIIMAGSIHGACNVLPVDKFREECDRRAQLGDAYSGLHPIFLCRWSYDESEGIFQSVTN